MNGAYKQRARGEIYAFPRDAPVASLAHGANTNQYGNHGLRFLQTPDQPSDAEHLANYKPTSSNAWLGLVINSSYSSINPYEPRPSTVPLMQSQGLRDMLPTKHDLPFAQTLSRGGPNASRSMKGITKFGLPTLPLKDGNGVQSSSSLPSPVEEFETRP